MADKGVKINRRKVDRIRRIDVWKLEALTEVVVLKVASFLDLKKS